MQVEGRKDLAADQCSPPTPIPRDFQAFVELTRDRSLILTFNHAKRRADHFDKGQKRRLLILRRAAPRKYEANRCVDALLKFVEQP